MPFQSPNGATCEDFEDCVDVLASDDDNALSESDAKAICGKWQSQTKEENSMKVVDLSPMKNELSNEELQEFDLGQIVETPSGVGIIAAFAEESFEYPVGSADRVDRIEEEGEDVEMEEIEASEDDPIYIVALQDGGSTAVSADDISGDAALEDDDGAEITDWEEVTGEGDEAELAPIYEYVDDPNSYEELQAAKVKYIHENYATELADYVDNNDATLATLEELSAEELVNIPGVDDPNVGFDELPPGWTRKSVLQAWASLGGMWRTCFPRMIRVRGPNFSRRWCSAMKDEVLRTEEWRGKF